MKRKSRRGALHDPKWGVQRGERVRDTGPVEDRTRLSVERGVVRAGSRRSIDGDGILGPLERAHG